MYTQRDIVLIQFQFSDLSESKLRPAAIISSKKVNAYGDLICVQITSKAFSDGLYMKLEVTI